MLKLKIIMRLKDSLHCKRKWEKFRVRFSRYGKAATIESTSC